MPFRFAAASGIALTAFVVATAAVPAAHAEVLVPALKAESPAPPAGTASEDDAFVARLFGGPTNKPMNYACFVRVYDADHLARHKLQKVSGMKLLVTAEKVPEDDTLNYSFRLGVKYRNRSGAFDSSGSCGHSRLAENGSGQMKIGCGVDCDGGGIDIGLSKDNKSTLVALERIRIWRNNAPDEEASDNLVAGADDRIFRLDRAKLSECASLVTDRKELAAMRRK